MDAQAGRGRWSLPYESPLPADPRWQGPAKLARIAAYVVLAAALIVPAVQFQVKTASNLKKGQDAGFQKGVKASRGAIGRWRKAVHAFWAGQNIYLPYPAERTAAQQPEGRQDIWMHPNMPFVVILLTPFAYLPVWAMALSFNLLKIAALLAAGLWAVRVVNQREAKMPDWVLGLALVWGMLLIVDDILHGNTNSFVVAAVVLHLWLCRRGRDVPAGAALALGICLKLTPALFGLYWLYQRNWRLLGGLAAALVIMIVLVPLAALGPAQFSRQTGAWWDNVIAPAALKGEWYPAHINQSISGVLGRYFLGGQPGGDIYSNPDDLPYALLDEHGWIAVASLPEATVRWMVRGAQGLVLALMAWAIGWRRLDRDDPRRALHYGLVILGMMLLNQRTWEHHAGLLVLTSLAAWYAIAYSGVTRRVRATTIALMILGGIILWLGTEGTFVTLARLTGRAKQAGEHWSNLAEAYGLTFAYFLVLFVTTMILAVRLRKVQPPYLPQRQKLFA